MTRNTQAPAGTTSGRASPGTAKSPGIEKDVTNCTGQCTALAKHCFDKANQLSPPVESDRAEVDKRFQFLKDVAATDPHKDAEIVMEHALALYELAYGQEHPELAEVMMRLALLYSLHGDKESADYITRWAKDLLRVSKAESEHDFFHLFGISPANDKPRGLDAGS